MPRSRRVVIFLALTVFVVAGFAPAARAQSQEFTETQNTLIRQTRDVITKIEGFDAWLYDRTDIGGFSHPAYPSEIDQLKGWYADASYHYETVIRSKARTRDLLDQPGPIDSDVHYVGGTPVRATYREALDFLQARCLEKQELLALSKRAAQDLLAFLEGGRRSPDQLTGPGGARALMETIDAISDNLFLHARTGVDACQLFFVDVYQVYYRAGSTSPGPDNAFICVANFVLDKSQHPDPNGDGVCEVRRIDPWQWSPPPKCDGTCNIAATPMHSSSQSFPLWVPRYGPYDSADRPTPENPRGGDDWYKKLYTNMRNQLEHQIQQIKDHQAGAEAATQQAQQAAQEAAEQGADSARFETGRGSALSLSLPFSDIGVPALIGRVINALLGITGALALGFFVYGGFVYMTAGGVDERVDRAKKTLVWSTLGLVAIFTSYAVVNFLVRALAGS